MEGRSRSRLLVSFPLALGAVLAFVAPAASGAVPLQPCRIGEGPTDAYCARLEVFEDHAAAAGRKIGLHIVVLPALKQRSERDPLFVLAGGPGEAAADPASGVQAIFRPLQKTRDIVLVDQRGTGRSNALRCKDAAPGPVHGAPTAVERARACLAQLETHADPTKYATDDAVEDLEAVRRFLGYDRINLYGVSYGTRPAMAYAYRYPAATRTVVLDGVSPPAMRQPLYAPRDAQRALDRLVADCEKSAPCAARYPGLRTNVSELFGKLGREPQPARYSDPNTGLPATAASQRSAVAQGLLLALYSPATAALVPLLVERAQRGDVSGFLAMSAAARVTLDRLAQGAFLSVMCSEDAPGLTAEAIEREAAGTFLGAGPGRTRLAICAQWPRARVAPAADAFPSTVRALIVSGELDPVAPPVWGEYVAAHWKGARHVVVPGAGHPTIATGCVMALMSRFIDQGDAAGLDTSCLAALHRPPFFLNPSGPVQGEAAS